MSQLSHALAIQAQVWLYCHFLMCTNCALLYSTHRDGVVCIILQPSTLLQQELGFLSQPPFLDIRA